MMSNFLSAHNSEARQAVRHLVTTGEICRSPVSAVIVACQLDLNWQELVVLTNGTTWDGYDPSTVAAQVRQRFGIGDSEPIGRALAAQGVLTEDEGRWLDDVE